MHLDRSGIEEAPTVVLLHGIPGSPESWRPVADRLSRRLDVVIPHLLGFGQSPDAADIRAEAQAEVVGEALQRAGVARATVVGHDFGGPVAMSLYRRGPELFDGLMLASTNAFPDTPIPFPLSLVTAPGIGDLAARLLFSRPSLKLMLRHYGGRQMGEARSVRRIFTASLQNLDDLYHEYPQILRAIECPTTILWGDQDPFFPVAQAERMAALVHDAELHIVAGAGHFLLDQRPDEVAGAIEALCTRATRREHHQHA